MPRRAPRPEPTDLDARKAAILEAVVTEHIDTKASPSARRPSRAAATWTSRRPRCALRWWRSSARATSPSPTPRPGGCRPTRATATSSTTSRPGPWAPPSRSGFGDFFANVRGEVEDVLEQHGDAPHPAHQLHLGRGGRGPRPLDGAVDPVGQPRRAPSPSRHRLLRRGGHQAQRLHRLRRQPGRGRRGQPPAPRAPAGHDDGIEGPGAQPQRPRRDAGARGGQRPARRAPHGRGRAGLHRRVLAASPSPSRGSRRCAASCRSSKRSSSS